MHCNGDDEEEDKYHDDDRQRAPDDHPDMGEEDGEEDADDDGGRVDSQYVPHPFHINSQQQQIKATPLPYNTIKASHMEGNKEKISFLHLNISLLPGQTVL